MNRYYYLALIVLFFGLSASCWLGYQLIGATVDENGLLVEVFSLIPLAWFFLLLGLITGFYLIWKIVDRKSGKLVFKLKQYLYQQSSPTDSSYFIENQAPSRQILREKNSNGK